MSDTTNGQNGHATTTATKTVNPELHGRLTAYRDEQGLSLTDLARQLGSNASQISRYFAQKPVGDVERLEAIAEDVLKSAQGRDPERITLFETSVTRQLRAVCETIRTTNDIGLIHGPAGLGKTCGIELYLAANPSAIGVTMSRWNAPRKHRGDHSGIESLVFNSIETRGWSGHTRRADFLIDRLKGSNRLLIIDNAHRLTSGGLQWVFDFADATRCPIALAGNPEVLDAIRRNDQMFSRIGLMREVRLKDLAEAVEAMLAQLAPEHAEAVRTLALQIAGKRGHLRALKKHLRLMPEFLAACKGDAATAFRTAHTQLVSDTQL